MTAAMLNTATVGRVAGVAGAAAGGAPGAPGCDRAVLARYIRPATPSAADNNANVRFTPSPPLVRGRPARVPVLTGAHTGPRRGRRGRSATGDFSLVAAVAPRSPRCRGERRYPITRG